MTYGIFVAFLGLYIIATIILRSAHKAEKNYDYIRAQTLNRLGILVLNIIIALLFYRDAFNVGG